MYLLVGNIIALIASIVMVYTGTIKKKKKILAFQCLQIALYTVSNLVLGGITGAIINVLGLIRNILCYYEKLGLKEKIIITIASILTTLPFNNLGVVGLLPLLSAITYLWFMNVKDVKRFKLLNALTTFMWFIYDLAIKSYTASIFDFMNVVANVITVFQIKCNKKECK